MNNQTQMSSDANEIDQRARELLSTGSVGNDLLRKAAMVVHSLPVQSPDGKLHSWFVPVTINDRLAAFFQFLPDGLLMRFSSFQRDPGKFDGCPLAVDWLDKSLIQARATSQKQSDETLSEPFLTYDRAPDQLVWAVPLTDKRGNIRLVYVVGEMVYLPPPEGTFG